MSQPDLALPDSPELPAEIEAAFMDAVWAPRAEKIREMHKARSVIAKHLLTREENRAMAEGWTGSNFENYEEFERAFEGAYSKFRQRLKAAT